jgi:GNAT superfamily N-acetyltransferase
MFDLVKLDGTDQNLLQGVANLFISYHQFYHQSLKQPIPSYQQALQYLTTKLINRNSYCLLAIANKLDLPAGFVQIYPIYNPLVGTKRWVIYDLFVAEFARKQGLGSQLLAKVAQEATKDPTVNGLQLTTANDNIIAQRRYKEKGYQIDEYNCYYSLTLPGHPILRQDKIHTVKQVTEITLGHYSSLLKELFPNGISVLLAQQLQRQQSYLFIAEQNKALAGLALVVPSYCSLEMQAIWIIDKLWLVNQEAYTAAALLNVILAGAKLNKITTLTIKLDPTEKVIRQSIEQVGFTTDSYWQQYCLPLQTVEVKT